MVSPASPERIEGGQSKEKRRVGVILSEVPGVSRDEAKNLFFVIFVFVQSGEKKLTFMDLFCSLRLKKGAIRDDV
jgi:hypothetical protein